MSDIMAMAQPSAKEPPITMVMQRLEGALQDLDHTSSMLVARLAPISIDEPRNESMDSERRPTAVTSPIVAAIDGSADRVFVVVRRLSEALERLEI